MIQFPKIMDKGRALIQRFVEHINQGVPISELEEEITNVRFKEVRDGDTILYLPSRDLVKGLTDIKIVRAYDDQLVVKPTGIYDFRFNLKSMQLDFRYLGGNGEAQTISKFNMDCWYRLE